MSDPSFWENGDHAKEISQKATEAKAAYDTYTRLFARNFDAATLSNKNN